MVNSPFLFFFKYREINVLDVDFSKKLFFINLKNAFGAVFKSTAQTARFFR
jgi:hypothetical protein